MRTELFHPIVIHFPLALLLLGSALRLSHYFLRKSSFEKLSLSIAWSFLILGVCFSWLAVITGEIAADVVGNALCNENILDYHSGFAYSTASLFSAALVLDFTKWWIQKSFKNLRILTTLIALFYTSASVFLVIVGFLGGNLVYEQGAAVKKTCLPNGHRSQTGVGSQKEVLFEAFLF